MTEERLKDGVYYYFDPDAGTPPELWGRRLYPEDLREYMKDPTAEERDFIGLAANIEVSLEKVTVEGGRQVERRTIYDPYNVHGKK